MIPKAARARLQNIKTSKYVETRQLTEDVFGECVRKPLRGDTPHARESLTMSKIKNYREFWFPYKNQKLPWWLNTVRKLLCIALVSGYRTKIIVVTKYRATITVHYRGGWLPYKVFRGCQLPSTNYCAIPWWLFTAANVTEMKGRYRGKPCFLTKNKKTKKMPNEWRTIKSLVHKILLHCQRGKGMTESFSREKLRHAPQKEDG